MDYIDRMIALRIDGDDTQEDLAKSLDVSRAQWAKYETRTHEMSIRTLVKFCQYYGVSADYILGLGRDLKWPR